MDQANIFWVEQTRHREEQVKDPEAKTCLQFSGSSRRSRLKLTDLGEVGKVGGEATVDNGIW